MENAFDALCSTLAEPEMKEAFMESEGVELMVICMKEKKLSRARAIKVSLDRTKGYGLGWVGWSEGTEGRGEG